MSGGDCVMCDGTKVVSCRGHDTGCDACYVAPTPCAAVEGAQDTRAAFYAESTAAVQRQEGDQVVNVEGFMRALARLTAPPARTYAEGVQKAVAGVLLGEMFMDPDARWELAGKIAAAIRLLSQGEKA